PERFAGGRITLDGAAALQAIARHIGAPLKLEGIWPAVGIVEMVDENMANAARVHAIERGKQPSEYTMVAFGGGAPLHAARVADKLGIDKVIIPVSAGVGSAIGFLRAPISHEVVRSWRSLLSANRLEKMNRLIAAMREEAVDTVRAGAGTDDLIVTSHVELRYCGQGHELPVALPDQPLTAEDLAQINTRFEAQYKRIFGLTMPELHSECISWSVSAATEPAPGTPLPPLQTCRKVTPDQYRDVYDPIAGKSIPHGLFARASLDAGDDLDGPAVVTESETSTIVPTGFALLVDRGGAMIINRRTEKVSHDR
ncbi:MAG: hydantoinase/oxoprolinase family protein, partial [Alphaproteobacteria bacterium]|nr:hydantoinase/oxoprolinase family protein [Alphaproteobacteria bacterium]